MKTEQEIKIENDIKAEIQLDLDDDSIDMLKVSDEEFEDYLLAHAHFMQTNYLKAMSKGYVKTATRFLLANTAVSSLVGVALSTANPIHPMRSATTALITMIPGLLFSLPKYYDARRIGKLSRTSQELRPELAKKYFSKEKLKIYWLCEQLVDGINPLENLLEERQKLAQYAAENKTNIDTEEKEELHHQIVAEYLKYAEYCDAAYNSFLAEF